MPDRSPRQRRLPLFRRLLPSLGLRRPPRAPLGGRRFLGRWTRACALGLTGGAASAALATAAPAPLAPSSVPSAARAPGAGGDPAVAPVTVHKTPWCSCCERWVRHLRQSGFTVRVRAHRDLAPVRAALGVPTPLAGCHTALVAGYVVEGHVPAGAIARLFDTRPEAVGLAVPGMPAGSPGMEGPLPAEVYDVLLFNAEAARGFARYEGGAVQAWAAPVAP